MQERWQALRLSRRQKAIALCVASLCVWAGSGWTMRLQVLLLGALTVRCNLKPAEVCCPCLPIVISWGTSTHRWLFGGCCTRVLPMVLQASLLKAAGCKLKFSIRALEQMAQDHCSMASL